MASKATIDNATNTMPEPALTSATFDPPEWGGPHVGPVAPVRMAAIGIRRTWPLLIAVSLGMLVAVVLVSTVPLYTNLVSAVQLQHVLHSRPPVETNIEVLANSNAVSASNADSTDKRMAGIATQQISGLAPTSTRYVQAGAPLLIPLINGAATNDPANPLLQRGSQALAFGYDMTQAAPHMQIFSGRLPQDVAAGQMPEVLVTSKFPNIKAGDTLTIAPFGSPSLAVTFRVAGVWYPKDEADPFWNGRSFDTPPTPDVPSPPPTNYPLVFTSATLLSALALPPTASNSRPLGMVLHYVYFTDPTRIKADKLPDAIGAIKSFRAQVSGNIPGSNAIFTVAFGTQLDKLLTNLQAQLSLLGLPLYVVVAQVVGLALLFVVAMAGLLVEGQAGEIATLKSRGASGSQMLASYTLQGLLLAGIAALAGPLLAASLSLALVRYFLPTAAEMTDTTYLSQAASPQAAVLPALAGALLSVLALVFAALRAARLDVLAFRREQGRSSQTPFWRKYYLDLALVALCAVGYLELGQFGGLNVRSQLGGASATGPDPLLLAAPGLLLLAGSLLVLRFFPLAAQLGARIAARGRGATSMLAFGQVARSSNAFGRLTLLLTLAVGLGLFALNYQSALQRNASDRASYLAGGDELTQVNESTHFGEVHDRIAKLPGVLGATPIFRTRAATADYQVGGSANVLAIDPTTFGDVANWRADYASQPLATLMAQMNAHVQGDPAGDGNHAIWALVDPTFADALHLHTGDKFSMVPEDSRGAVHFVVGAIVNNMPTMFDSLPAGYMVTDARDYFRALLNPDIGSSNGRGANEYWLKTTGNAQDTKARAKALLDPSLPVISTIRRADVLAQLQADPLASGMTGLLLVGAITAAVLAVVGSVVQSALGARQRLRQFAILRTLGMASGQLSRMLLTEQTIVYFFGLLGGAALGLVLSTATLPFLQFSSGLASPDQIGVPPYLLVVNWTGSAIFFTALLGAFVLALLLAGRVAASVGLGKTLRLGED